MLQFNHELLISNDSQLINQQIINMSNEYVDIKRTQHLV